MPPFRLTNNPKMTPPRVVKGPTLLTGLAVCASCGAGITRTGTKRRHKTDAYYSCAGCRPDLGGIGRRGHRRRHGVDEQRALPQRHAPATAAATIASGEVLVEHDEHPRKVSPDKIAKLKPAFRADGTSTAATHPIAAERR